MTYSSRFLACFTLALAAAGAVSAQNSNRANLFPKLRAGQTFSYRIGCRTATRTTTASSVAAPMAPTSGENDAQFLLVAEVQQVQLESGKPFARLSTRLSVPVISPGNAAAPATPPSDASSKIVEFTVHANGQVTDLLGFDKLSPIEQSSWQEWLARFAAAGTFPERGIRPGDKWKADEPIASTLIAALSWDKESEYVNDAPCATDGSSPETCAVILTTATLKQRSNPKDATPEDYKLHDLRTLGTAKGKNEIVSYISLKTGLVVRATEDATQSLNVIVAKTDGSNRVHYTIEAESHAQVVLLPASASN